LRLCVTPLMTLLMSFQVADRSIGVPCEIALDATTNLPFGYRDLGVMISHPEKSSFIDGCHNDSPFPIKDSLASTQGSSGENVTHAFEQ
jgi:hypothetical protein